MAGILSSLFDSADSIEGSGTFTPAIDLDGGNDHAGDGGSAASSPPDQSGEAQDPRGDGQDGGSSSSHSGSEDMMAHGAFDPTVSVHSEMNGSMTTMDGTTHSWSDTEDVQFTAHVGALVGETAGYTADEADA